MAGRGAVSCYNTLKFIDQWILSNEQIIGPILEISHFTVAELIKLKAVAKNFWPSKNNINLVGMFNQNQAHPEQKRITRP